MKKISDRIHGWNYPRKQKWLDEFDEAIKTDEPDIIMTTARECVDSNLTIGMLCGIGIAYGIYRITGTVKDIVKYAKEKKESKEKEENEEE